MQRWVASFSSLFRIPSQSYVHYLGWCVRGESLLSMKCPTPLSLLSPRTYPCGRQLFPWSEKPCAAREQTRRWDPLFTESSRRLDYLPQTCVRRCRLVMIRTSRDGATMSFAVFGHRSSSAISRSRRWGDFDSLQKKTPSRGGNVERGCCVCGARWGLVLQAKGRRSGTGSLKTRAA